MQGVSPTRTQLLPLGDTEAASPRQTSGVSVRWPCLTAGAALATGLATGLAGMGCRNDNKPMTSQGTSSPEAEPCHVGAKNPQSPGNPLGEWEAGMAMLSPPPSAHDGRPPKNTEPSSGADRTNPSCQWSRVCVCFRVDRGANVTKGPWNPH